MRTRGRAAVIVSALSGACFGESKPVDDGGDDASTDTGASGSGSASSSTTTTSASGEASGEVSTVGESGASDDASTESGSGNASDSTGVAPACGDGTVQPNEDCDGMELNDGSCASLGFYPDGKLACREDCVYETTGCSTCAPQFGDCTSFKCCEGLSCFNTMGMNLCGML